MHVSILELNLSEKLAVIHMIDAVILADQKVHSGELTILIELMNRLDFDSNLIQQSRIIENDQALQLVREMTNSQKKTLSAILREVAISDGFIHSTESQLILKICAQLRVTIDLK